MQILPEYSYPYVLDNVSGPVVPKYSWFYDAELNDFLLRPIRLLEETTGQTVLVKINGTEFQIPASWNLLVVDEETKMVDTVQITQCSSSNYLAFLTHPDEHDYALSKIILLDLLPSESCVHVMIPRMHMMMHPVGPVDAATSVLSSNKKTDLHYCCLLTPQDLGKYMHGMTVMEIVL
jgi:hypothetical protein